MKKKEKEIKALSEIEDIIHASQVCRLGMSDDDIPYIIPVCFGYQDNTLFIHSALKGKKIDILRKNNRVCFEFDINTQPVPAEKPCKWGMQYKSVAGNGTAVFLEDPEEKKAALGVIMSQYSDKAFEFPIDAVNATTVIKIKISKITGKQSGFL